jgi:hypothetical protein
VKPPRGQHTPTRPPSAVYYQAFNVPIRRTAVAVLDGQTPYSTPKFNAPKVRQRRTAKRVGSLRSWSKSPGNSPDSVAPPTGGPRAIKGAAAPSHDSRATGPDPATFTSAQALADCLLPSRQQIQKCLKLTHRLMMFWSFASRRDETDIGFGNRSRTSRAHHQVNAAKPEVLERCCFDLRRQR